jgi:hypothetical protein
MQCMIDLATHNYLVPELREEISQITAQRGGTITKQALADMLKLDSFIKETHRLNLQDLSMHPSSLRRSAEK